MLRPAHLWRLWYDRVQSPQDSKAFKARNFTGSYPRGKFTVAARVRRCVRPKHASEKIQLSGVDSSKPTSSYVQFQHQMPMTFPSRSHPQDETGDTMD